MRLKRPNRLVARSLRGPSAYTLTEIVVALSLLGITTVSLFAAFSSGTMLVQLARENLRATQILTQKMELVRLFTWDQMLDPAQVAPTFTEWYDPACPNSGTQYQGVVSIDNAPADFPADYRNNLRLVSVTVYWTNYPHGASAPLVRSRQMQTCLARYGLQSVLSR